MRRKSLLVPLIALFAVAGCGEKTSEPNIGMGPEPVQPGMPAEGASLPAATPAPVAVDPMPVAVGDGVASAVFTTCNVEQANGQAFTGSAVQVSKQTPVAVSGWVVEKAASDGVELRLVNIADASTYRIPLTANVAREDVAATFNGQAAAANPGFTVAFNAKALAAGDYRLQIVVPGAEGGAAACDNGRVISLAD